MLFGNKEERRGGKKLGEGMIGGVERFFLRPNLAEEDKMPTTRNIDQGLVDRIIKYMKEVDILKCDIDGPLVRTYIRRIRERWKDAGAKSKRLAAAQA